MRNLRQAPESPKKFFRPPRTREEVSLVISSRTYFEVILILLLATKE